MERTAGSRQVMGLMVGVGVLILLASFWPAAALFLWIGALLLVLVVLWAIARARSEDQTTAWRYVGIGVAVILISGLIGYFLA